MLIVKTTCLSSRKGKDNSKLLDITVKGKSIFAPTWEIVMAIKEGRINEKEYTDRYFELMRQSYRENKQEWLDILKLDEIILGCYCPKGKYCHRYITAWILKKLGAKYVGEI
jgi:uncharacterized protein YeaO (DUF488 family)